MSTRSEQRDERIAAILDAARRVLVERGAEALTLRGVATATGIRLGHLQHFFPTRDALLVALLRAVLDEGEARILEALTDFDPTDDAQVDRGVRLLLANQRDPLVAGVCMELWPLARRDPGVRAAMHAFYDGWAERLADALAPRHASLSRAERVLRARVFISCMEGTSLVRSGAIGEPDARFEALARRWLRALLADEPPAPGEAGGDRARKAPRGRR